MSVKGPIFILSVDGGGSRGVIPANVLNFIEREELVEIESIAAEFGLTPNGNLESG